jgi:predicted deacylase
MPDRIVINGIPIAEGESVSTQLRISKLPSGTVIDIPVLVHRSVNPGPVVLLMAGMHGDEVNGIEIIRRMVKGKMLFPIKGTIIAIPILNIYGFLNFSRQVPDGKDVNRSFPGNSSGSLASRVAYRLMKEIIPHIDIGIDYHTGGANRSNYPQIRCKMKEENKRLAQAFCAPFTLHSPHRKGSLRREASKLGKSILVYEAGESLRFDEKGINIAIEGTRRLLHHLEMVSTSEPTSASVVCTRTSWIRAQRAGLFRSFVKNGEFVRKSQVLGSITDPYGEMELKLKSPTEGYVIGLNHMPVVNQGDALLHIGIRET